MQPRPSVLATVAHELRGPLSALQTASELLARDFDHLDREQARTMVSSIYRRALWLGGLTENLLCAASVDDGRLRVALLPVDVQALVEDAAVLVRPVLQRKRQRLRVRSSGAVARANADPHRLSQVLVNLLSNASKYSDPETTIDVAIRHRTATVRVTVFDRGPGVSPEYAGHLFQAYDRAGRTDGEGLGIGLSVVRSIIEAHGGRVGFANRAGGGAAFWFELATIERATADARQDHIEMGMSA